MAPILIFEDVRKEYASEAEGARVAALGGVSLTIERGEFVALMGPSGCGKSTLLHLAGAMDAPTGGRVVVDGVDPAGLDDAGLTRLRREKIGFVFQSFQLLPALTVVENVEVPLLLAGRAGARERAMERLRWVGLEGLAGRRPYQLSGGQQQRVAMARALAGEPRLLLADEPTGNLDSAAGAGILELLERLVREEGVTVVMATHEAGAAERAGRVVRLRDGRVV